MRGTHPPGQPIYSGWGRLGGVKMEKVYRLLPWLNFTQASNWLEDLTGTAIRRDDLLQLCEVVGCPVYLDCRDVIGGRDAGASKNQQLFDEVAGEGYCKIDQPTLLYEDRLLYVTGPAKIGSASHVTEDCKWHLDYDESRGPLLKPADIQALAAKMNAHSGQPTPPPEVLRQQFEQEHLAGMLEERKKEDEASRERAYQDAITTIEHLKSEIEQERAARKAAETEAEEAKSDAEHWWQQHELELECRLRTQAEVDELQAELTRRETAAKPSHLLTIAALMELLGEPGRAGRNQSAIMAEIQERHTGKRGLSKRNLEEIFAAANKANKEVN